MHSLNQDATNKCQHASLSWTACKEDNCLTHLDDKHSSGYFPKKSNKNRARKDIARRRYDEMIKQWTTEGLLIKKEYYEEVILQRNDVEDEQLDQYQQLTHEYERRMMQTNKKQYNIIERKLPLEEVLNQIQKTERKIEQMEDQLQTIRPGMVYDTMRFDINTEIAKRNALCKIYDVENREQHGTTYKIRDWKELNVILKGNPEYEIFIDNYTIRKEQRVKYQENYNNMYNKYEEMLKKLKEERQKAYDKHTFWIKHYEERL